MNTQPLTHKIFVVKQYFLHHKVILAYMCIFDKITNTTLQPLYNMVHFNTVLDIHGSKKDPKNAYIILKKDHKWSFFNIIYTFLFGYNTVV